MQNRLSIISVFLLLIPIKKNEFQFAAPLIQFSLFTKNNEQEAHLNIADIVEYNIAIGWKNSHKAHPYYLHTK